MAEAVQALPGGGIPQAQLSGMGAGNSGSFGRLRGVGGGSSHHGAVGAEGQGGEGALRLGQAPGPPCMRARGRGVWGCSWG